MLQWVQHSIPERTKRSLEARDEDLSQSSGGTGPSYQGDRTARGPDKFLIRRSSEPQTDAESRGSGDSTPPVRAASTPPTAAATEYQGISQASKLSSASQAGTRQRPTADSESHGAYIRNPTIPNSQGDGLLLPSSPGKGKEVVSGKPRTQNSPLQDHTTPPQSDPIASNSFPEGHAQIVLDSETRAQPLDRDAIRQALLEKIGVKPGDTVEYTVHHRDAVVHEQVFPQTHTIYQPTRTYDVHIHEHRKIYQPLLDTDGGQEQDDYYVHSEY